MFINSNEKKDQIDEFELYNISLTNETILISNQKDNFEINFENILYDNKKITFPSDSIDKDLSAFYREKFSNILNKIEKLCTNDSYLKENAEIILTSNLIERNGLHSYNTYNAVILSPIQNDKLKNQKILLEPFLNEFLSKYSNFISQPDHILELQNFDSTYKFQLNWRTEIPHLNNNLNQNENEIYVSLNKQGIYLSEKEVKFY